MDTTAAESASQEGLPTGATQEEEEKGEMSEEAREPEEQLQADIEGDGDDGAGKMDGAENPDQDAEKGTVEQGGGDNIVREGSNEDGESNSEVLHQEADTGEDQGVGGGDGTEGRTDGDQEIEQEGSDAGVRPDDDDQGQDDGEADGEVVSSKVTTVSFASEVQVLNEDEFADDEMDAEGEGISGEGDGDGNMLPDDTNHPEDLTNGAEVSVSGDGSGDQGEVALSSEESATDGHVATDHQPLPAENSEEQEEQGGESDQRIDNTNVSKEELAESDSNVQINDEVTDSVQVSAAAENSDPSQGIPSDEAHQNGDEQSVPSAGEVLPDLEEQFVVLEAVEVQYYEPEQITLPPERAVACANPMETMAEKLVETVLEDAVLEAFPNATNEVKITTQQASDVEPSELTEQSEEQPSQPETEIINPEQTTENVHEGSPEGEPVHNEPLAETLQEEHVPGEDIVDRTPEAEIEYAEGQTSEVLEEKYDDHGEIDVVFAAQVEPTEAIADGDHLEEQENCEVEGQDMHQMNEEITTSREEENVMDSEGELIQGEGLYAEVPSESVFPDMPLETQQDSVPEESEFGQEMRLATSVDPLPPIEPAMEQGTQDIQVLQETRLDGLSPIALYAKIDPSQGQHGMHPGGELSLP